jgi:hypothetical protein
MGGFAGGSKYFVDSIFFKFPSDEHNLYGGVEGLMKACGHEVKGFIRSIIIYLLINYLGLMSFIDCLIEGLYFPLMVLIDFRYVLMQITLSYYDYY